MTSPTINNNLLAIRQYVKSITKGVVNLSEKHLLEIDKLYNTELCKIIILKYNSQSENYEIQRTIYMDENSLYHNYSLLKDGTKMFYRYEFYKSNSELLGWIYSVSSSLID